ncbi:Alpha-pyrone synthesis polyketide synthase-like Pks18 [compost metagenome]
MDSVQKVMNLTGDHTKYSREILRTVGNISSVTIIFVLNVMRQEMKSMDQDREEGIAMAFGPGLTAELMRFTYMPAYTAAVKEQDHAFL